MTETRIHLLSPQLANQIAAGEVIERPAAVLKELLENSLDAGAHRIEIDIEKGGMQLIRVRDDGFGIHPDDLALALSRHATSKVHTLKDLENITSLGFRGEALASMGSVSRLSLSSCLRGQNEAWKVETIGRNLEAQITATAHPTGTTVEVRDLFFNTPARRRFLRTEQTEFGHIDDLLKRILLSRFEIGFTLRHNQKMIRQAKPATTDQARQQRLANIMGSHFMEHAISFDIEIPDMRLWGWITLPEFSRNQTDLQYCYLNGRSIRDKLINHAIRLAYQDTLLTGRHPGFVLYLELDPSTVDVNVHPTKHEVRFHNSRMIHDALFSNLRRILSGEHSTTQIEETPAVYHVNPKSVHLSPIKKDTIKTGEACSAPTILGTAIAQLHDRYILAENTAGLIILDIPLARTACLKKQLSEKTIRTQPLLLPLSIDVSKSIANYVEQQTAFLATLGFDISRLDNSKIRVRYIPVLLKDINLESFIPVFLQALLTEILDATSLLAHHAGQHLPTKLSLSSMNDLLRMIENLELTMTQPRCWKQISLDIL